MPVRHCLRCPCGVAMRESEVDHPYHYDHGTLITLRTTKLTCNYCNAYELEIPKLGPLHETIKQALRTLRVKRDRLAFRFNPGRAGVVDGAWGVVIRS